MVKTLTGKVILFDVYSLLSIFEIKLLIERRIYILSKKINCF